MARDYYDESKGKNPWSPKKKKKEKETKPKASSPSVSSKVTSSTYGGGTTGSNYATGIRRTTSSGGGSNSGRSTSSSTPQNNTPQPTYSQRRYQKTGSNYGRERQMHSGGVIPEQQRRNEPVTSSRRNTPVTSTSRQRNGVATTSREMMEQRKAEQEAQRNRTSTPADDNRAFMQRQKSGLLTAEDQRKAQEKADRKAQIRQAQKSGDYERASKLHDEIYGPSEIRDKVNEWDKDISDTITQTLKQVKASDIRYLNQSMQGITQKDAFLYTTEDQRKKADEKVARTEAKYSKQLNEANQALEDIKNKHGYLGQRGLEAVSSYTGLVVDLGVGALTGGASLFHMKMRSTGGTMGQVKQKADALRSQLKSTGYYTDEELDEMFKDVEARDLLNAEVNGDIEGISELFFRGFGPVAKYVGGSSIAEKIGSKLLNKAGGKATSSILKNALKGTAEEVAEEEMAGPAESWASNFIYGNKFQGYQEDAIKRSLADQSNALRSQIQSPEDAQAAAARLSSPAFKEESIESYMEAGHSREDATQLTEMSIEYLSAALSGDVDGMKIAQDAMVEKLSGGENDQREKFTLQDAIDSAVSTAMMTLPTGLPGAMTTQYMGNSYKENFGLNAVKQQTEIIRNWGDEEDKKKADGIIESIDNGDDMSSTQVYEVIQKAAQYAIENKEADNTKMRTAEKKMADNDLRVAPIDSDGNLGPQTQQRYLKIISDTVSRYQALAKLSNQNEQAEDFVGPNAPFSKRNTEGLNEADVLLGADIGASFNTGVLESEQVNDLVSGSETVKEVFRDVTGVDISQFDNNKQMLDSLMAAAAENLVNSARLEQAAWNDEVKGGIADTLSKGIGGEGDKAVSKILDSVDPRDRSSFLLTADVARGVYERARNTEESWDETRRRFKTMYPSANVDTMKDVYKAAKEDKAKAETYYYGKVVESGEKATRSSLNSAETGYVPGKFTDKRQNKEGKSLKEESLLKAIASSFGINIEVVDDLASVQMDKTGKPVVDENGNVVLRQDNGLYNSATNTLVLNAHPDATKSITQTMAHELTHHIAVHAPKEYVKLQKYIMDAWYRQDAAGFDRAINATKSIYKAQKGQDLTTEQALEELIADGAADFDWSDEQFISDITVNEPSLAQAIINAIKDILRKIRSILASGDVIDEASTQALYSKAIELDTVRSMWVTAAQMARNNRAQESIDEWQDNANGELKHSITTDKEDFVKGANLSKELRDWAKEMGLDKLSSQPVKGPVIVSVRDLRTAWYEKNGRSDEANVINTALDKIGDSLTKLVGEYQYIDLGDALNAAVTYRTDAEGHPTSVILSCQVKNAEYEVNFDFTTICAKRLAMQKILERFIKTEGERQGTTLYDELKLDEEGLYKLRLILETAGFEVSCRGCFVEQNRYSQQNQARTIANDWNAALDEWARDNGTEVTENFGLTTLDIDNLDYEEIEAGFERYHELMKGKKTDVATKNRMLIEASPFFRKRMNASDYASMSGQRALMAIGESKKGGTNLYGLLKRGQSDSKQSVPFTAYNGEISLLPDNMKGKSLYDYLLSIGGARAQSASDFQIEFVYDYMQMVADLSARGLPMHMYTKVIELAELFGMTGIKINLSAMCDVAEDLGGEYAGLKLVDGKYEYNISDQSIDYEKAVELQKKEGYSKNIGIIMVTLSSQHMLKSLDDPDVRYIIGYHSSAMPVVVANMSNMGGATDYTKINKTNKLNEKGQALFDAAMEEAKGNTELEKYKDALRIFDEKIQEETAKKKKLPRRGNEYGSYMSAYGGNTADFNTYDSLLETKDARKTADKYLEHCMENDLIPIYFPFAFHENYYKCEIYDFNMYDNNTGEYAPMESVQNIYPGLNMAAGETDTTAFTERVSQMMDEQNSLNKSLDSQYDAVFDEAKNTLKYSITGDDYMDMDASGIDHSELTHRADATKTEAQMRDDAYMDAVNSGNMDEAQRFVDEAALQMPNVAKAVKGRVEKPIPLYHGTRFFGFTEFKDSKYKVPFIYTSTNHTVSAHYAGDQHYAFPRPIGKPYREGDSTEDIIENAKTVWQSNYHVMTPAEKKARYTEVINEASKIAEKIDELSKDVTFDSFADGDDYSMANAIDLLKYPFWVSRDMDDDFYYNFDEDNGYREESVSYHEDAIEGFERNIERVREYYFENRKKLNENQKKLLSYLISYEVGDAAIDLRSVLKVMTEEDRLINEYGNINVPSGMKEAMDQAHNIASYELYGDLGENPFEFDANGGQWFALKVPEVSDEYVSTDQVCKWAYEHGYTSVIMHNIYDYGDKADNYVFFNSGQVKSADTVTYAEDGSVIPLSERFDPENDDIRYSLPTQDSDGNILTDGQMEFFKNSQARDEQGRLVPVYHGTMRGPRITIFDGSNDGYWFTANRDIAIDYSMGYDMGTPGSLVGTERNPYDTDEEYFEKHGIRLEERNGYWSAVKEYSGRELSWGAAESKEDLIEDLYASAESEDTFDSQFSLRDYYPVYLNLENPKVIDCNESMHDDINDTGMSTRDLAAEAKADGYDGIIFLNVVDPFEPHDVYVAFSSTQIKDVRNENPTENPDIRYSVADGNSTMDYMQSKAESTDDLWANDPVIAEGRVRYSMSRKDFVNASKKMYDDKWQREYRPETLDISEDNIRKVIMAAMESSDTNARYRQKTVRNTIERAKIAYNYLHNSDPAKAAEVIFDHSMYIVENLEFFVEDENFERWKELKKYLRNHKMTVDIEDRQPDYPLFRQNNFGKILLVNEGGINPIEAWEDLNKIWPDVFTKDIKNDPNAILKQAEYALEILKPLSQAYTSEECMDLASSIAQDILDIIYEGDNWHMADNSYGEKTASMKERHGEATRVVQRSIHNMRKQYTGKIKSIKQKNANKDEKKKYRQKHRQLYNRVLNEYNTLTDMLLKPSHKDRTKNIPEQLRQPVAEMLAVFDLEKERSKKLEEKYRIPTRTQLDFRQVKDALEKVAKEEGQSTEFETYFNYINGKITDIADKMDKMNTHTIDALSNEDIEVIKDMLAGLIESVKNWHQLEIDGQSYQAQQICDKVSEGADEHQSLYGKAKKYGSLIGFLDNIVNMGELTPIYFFRQLKGMYDMYRQIRRGFDDYVRNNKMVMDRLSEIMSDYYKKNKRGQRVYGSEVEEWRHSETAETFDLTYGSITLTVAQRMSLYCLAKREQAKGHMLSDNGGVVASEITAGSKIHKAEEEFKGKTIEYKQLQLTPADIDIIRTSLTPEQMHIADELQKLMSDDMSELGNKTSMKMLGIKLYKETEYFPIRIQGESKGKDLDNISVREKVRNPGFSNPLKENATNPIIIDDIFTVVAKHCNEMNLYASYAVPLTNFMKVYNGSVMDEKSGKAVKIQTIIKETYGEKAIDYIDNFLDDINGNSFKRHGGLNDVLDKALGQAKKAAVFANLRVALQQPTAIVRAFAVMKVKYFKGVKPSAKETQEMFDHCPIALWKSLGYYDTHFGRDIEDVMMGKDVPSKMDKYMSEIYGALDNMTWGMIWQAVKNEITETRKDLKVGSPEFFEACAERASFVFDSTQVVDSPFHRSNDMRSKDTFTKQLTSFQAEPTLSFNVLRQGIMDAREAAKKGDTKKAADAISRIALVWVGQAFTEALAQSLVDALRRKGHKDGDDDEDQAMMWYEVMMKYFTKNFVNNFSDDVNPINKIYWFKDFVPGIVNVLKGEYVYGQQNLAYQWFDSLTKGIQAVKKKWEKGDSYKKSWYDCFTELMGGIGYMCGFPAKTVMRGTKNAFYWFNKISGANVFADDGTVKSESVIDSVLLKMGYRKKDSEGEASSGKSSKASDKEKAAEEKKAESKAVKKILKSGMKQGEKAIPKTEAQLLSEIEEKTIGYYGEDRDRRIWDIVSDGYTDYIEKGDYGQINKLRNVIEKAGGNVQSFDNKVLKASKSAYKKTMVDDPTDAQKDAQINIRNYLLENGMTEAEISAEICYKSDTARDLKAAFRMGNEDYIVDELVTLLRAGITREDIYKLYKYRNYGAKDYDGKYSQPEYRTSSGTYIWPTQGTITSGFGYRDAPTSGASSYHQGIDIGAPQGTPVIACDGGVVVEAGANGGYGNSVGIRHDDGTISYYNHLYTWGVKVGDKVSQGQQIGQVGSTGISTGPHLDFRLYKDGEYLDPTQYLQG